MGDLWLGRIAPVLLRGQEHDHLFSRVELAGRLDNFRADEKSESVVQEWKEAVMRKILFWLTVWFVVLCVCFALHGWSLVVVDNRAGIEVTEIDLVWFNPQWDGRGDDSFVKYNFWKSVIWFFGLWLGIPLLLAYGWTADERAERDEKEQKRIIEALRRHEERNRDGHQADI